MPARSVKPRRPGATLQNLNALGHRFSKNPVLDASLRPLAGSFHRVVVSQIDRPFNGEYVERVSNRIAVEGGLKMKRCIMFLAGIVALTPASLVGDTRAEQDRLQNAGKVMQEVLHIPDDIPQDLLNKARCVVVMPSVLKAVFVVGGSYGRGAMVCRTGKDFTGP